MFDAVPGRAAAFAREIGGSAAVDLPDLARACAIVITMLPNGGVVRSAVLGEGGDGLIEGLGRGSLLVDMGSSDPRVYPPLADALRARGVGDGGCAGIGRGDRCRGRHAHHHGRRRRRPDRSRWSPCSR